MGFFSDLKEDLSQAVSELLPDEDQSLKEQKEAEVSDTAGDGKEAAIPNDAKSLELLLEKMDADELLTDAVEEGFPIEDKEEPAIGAGSYFASVLGQEEEVSSGGLFEEPIQEEQLEEIILGNPDSEEITPEDLIGGVEEQIPEVPTEEAMEGVREEEIEGKIEEPSAEVPETAGMEDVSIVSAAERNEAQISVMETLPAEMSAVGGAEETAVLGAALSDGNDAEVSREETASFAVQTDSESGQGAEPEEPKEITAGSAKEPEMLDHKSENEEAMEGLQENEEETGIMKMDAETLENVVEEAQGAEENGGDNGGFGVMDSQLANKSAVDETAVITAGMTISGDIISEGSMEVIGTIVGNIDILGKLNITGSVQGNSKAAEIYCESAKITGEIASEGSVKIGQSTVIIGNISANSAVIAGAVKGDIDVHGPVVLDTSAIVMGNIKSKSVQINNGAVIEGMCSQCYADVNPSSFFEDLKVIGKVKGNK